MLAMIIALVSGVNVTVMITVAIATLVVTIVTAALFFTADGLIEELRHVNQIEAIRDQVVCTYRMAQVSGELGRSRGFGEA
jgi:hypothetical protein